MTNPTPPTMRRRNPRGQGERLRDEIVQAAALLLDETGSSESITLRAVARRAGDSRTLPTPIRTTPRPASCGSPTPI
ncbi:MAG: hypothetical protein WA892_02050 [Ornithinimicrobium sp.]